jgi:hydroxymethylglutaryl-CoA lyase
VIGVHHDIKITEVGPRDGLQNHTLNVPTDRKIAFIDALSATGVRSIEVTAFVNPSVIPFLADAQEVMGGITRNPEVTYSALVPNERGLERALKAGVTKIALFTSASETFCKKNINATIQESIARFAPVVACCQNEGVAVRAYISCLTHCPYEGRIAPDRVVEVAESLSLLGEIELDLGETIGQGTPDDVALALEAVGRRFPLEEVVLHLHDTSGHAAASIQRAVAMGVMKFDGAVGGLGGCPFAPGAAGNVSTQVLAGVLEAAGYSTGIDCELLDAAYRDLITAI